MTEFSLVLPMFLVIVAGLLGFGRVFFYWISANHLASETARWAAVDRNPDPATYGDPNTALQAYARDNGGTIEFSDAKVCIHYLGGGPPDENPAVGGPVEVTIAKPFSFVPILGIGTIMIRASSTMRIERFADGTGPTNYRLGSPFGACT